MRPDIPHPINICFHDFREVGDAVTLWDTAAALARRRSGPYRAHDGRYDWIDGLRRRFVVACRHTDAFADGNPVTLTDRGTHADSNARGIADTESNTGNNPDADTQPDANSYANPDTYSHTDSYANADPHTYADSYPYSYANPESGAKTDRHPA
jgi:hypothetical protein